MIHRASHVVAAAVLATSALSCTAPDATPDVASESSPLPPIPTLPPRATPTSTPSARVLEDQAAGLLSSAVEAAEDGQSERSLALLAAAATTAPDGSEMERRATYLLGRRLAERGDLEGARRELEISLSSEGPLTPYAKLTLARVLENSGVHEAAVRIYDELSADPGSPPDVRDAALEGLLALEGEQDPLPLAEAPSGPAALLALATALAEAEETGELRDTALQLITTYPASAEAIEAIRLTAAAGIELPPEATGLAYYRNRMLEETIDVLQPAAAEPGVPPGTLATRLYYLAAAIDDAGDPAASVPLYDSVRELVPATDLASRAAYWGARAVEATGDAESASLRYVALVSSFPESQFAPEAAFRAGFVWFQSGNANRALAIWDGAAAAADARVLYWTGRAYELTGQTSLATGAYEQAARETSFYGSEASRRMASTPQTFPGYAPLRDRAAPDWTEVEAWYTSHAGAAAPSFRTLTAAGVLASLGLRSDAEAALNAVADTKSSTAVLLMLVREASEANLARSATMLLQRLLAFYPTPYEALPPALQQVLYPIPFPSLLDEQARNYGIDPLLLAALVRQESLWDPGAVSFAGALGLTQVMPTTGLDIARALGVDPFDPSSLFDPTRSMRFGAYHLAKQLDALLVPAAALAAYNGGHRNAIYWASLHDPAADPAAYLEAITFPETHRYVELVLTGYVRYHALSSP